MNDESHFKMLFYFCVGMASAGILFLICLCYLPVPQGNTGLAENVEGFIEGSVVTAAISFLLGGNLPTKKANNPTVLQTGDAPQTTVNPTTNSDTPTT